MAIGLYGPEYLQFGGGGVARNVPIFIFLPGTKTKAVLFTDKLGQYTAPNPLYTDDRGELVFYVEEGPYDLYYAAADATFSIQVETDDETGPTGQGGYDHLQVTPAAAFQIPHNLTWRPGGISAIETITGDPVIPRAIRHPFPGVTELEFGFPFAGNVYLS